MSSDLITTDVNRKSESNCDHPNETATNVTVENENASLDEGNDNHLLLSSSSDSTISSSCEGSNIDLANLDEQRQLFNHILDKLNDLEMNLEKEEK